MSIETLIFDYLHLSLLFLLSVPVRMSLGVDKKATYLLTYINETLCVNGLNV